MPMSNFDSKDFWTWLENVPTMEPTCREYDWSSSLNKGKWKSYWGLQLDFCFAFFLVWILVTVSVTRQGPTYIYIYTHIYIYIYIYIYTYIYICMYTYIYTLSVSGKFLTWFVVLVLSRSCNITYLRLSLSKNHRTQKIGQQQMVMSPQVLVTPPVAVLAKQKDIYICIVLVIAPPPHQAAFSSRMNCWPNSPKVIPLLESKRNHLWLLAVLPRKLT